MTGSLLSGFGLPSADLGRAQGVSTAPVPRFAYPEDLCLALVFSLASSAKYGADEAAEEGAAGTAVPLFIAAVPLFIALSSPSVCVCVHRYIYVCTCVYTDTTHTHTLHVCIYIKYVYIYVYMYIYVYVYLTQAVDPSPG